MKLEVFCYSYNTMGGSTSLSLLADYLSSFLKPVVPENLVIEVTLCFRSAGPPKRTLEAIYQKFHDSLKRLPQVRYAAKKSHLSIRYESAVGSAEVALEFGPPVLALFTPGLQELSRLLPTLLLAHKTLRSAVNEAELTAAFRAALSSTPSSDSELQAYYARVCEEAKQAAATLSPWERLDVEWSRYHPRARAILNDPFFWNNTDGYAPHGNDTGADLLAAFHTWHRKTRGRPASEFLTALLRQWGIRPDALTWRVRDLATWSRDDELHVCMYDEALIAVAFAQLKYDAVCDPAARQGAIESIYRQLDPAVAAHFGWSVPAERIRRLKQLESILTASSA